MANPRVVEIQTQIQSLNAELDGIRMKCQHPGFTVEMWSWRPGAMHPERICTECLGIAPGITPEEAEACWKYWRQDAAVYLRTENT